MHTEKGRGCLCPETGRQRRLKGIRGGAGKVPCPAAAYGYGCAGRQRCYRAAGSQAGVFVERMDPGPAHFHPDPLEGYRRRPALRIYSRLDNDFEEQTARVGLALNDGRGPRTPGSMRSLVGAVPFADTDSVGFPRLGSWARGLEKPEGFLTPNGVGSAHEPGPRRRQGDLPGRYSGPLATDNLFNQQPEDRSKRQNCLKTLPRDTMFG